MRAIAFLIVLIACLMFLGCLDSFIAVERAKSPLGRSTQKEENEDRSINNPFADSDADSHGGEPLRLRICPPLPFWGPIPATPARHVVFAVGTGDAP